MAQVATARLRILPVTSLIRSEVFVGPEKRSGFLIMGMDDDDRRVARPADGLTFSRPTMSCSEWTVISGM
jgi:hypothetical protein